MVSESQRSILPTSTNVIPSSSAPDPFKYNKNDLAFHGRSTWSPDKEKILFGPYDYLFAHPGKDIRAQLIAAFNEWLDVPTPSLEIIIKVVGMLHTASLLVDDVEDSSLLRRGIPVAHSIFGTAQTINSANYAYFCALQELQKLGNPKALEIYTEELLNLHRGQGMDLFWRDTLTCPSEDDYLEMVGNKTGGLFRLTVKLMQAESKSTR
jgi:geranylgeranyl diphosphate synthase, type III